MAYIIMKYDDLSQESIEKFKRVADYSIKNNLPVSMGIKGYSLEKRNDEYLQLCKVWNENNIELWNHGYYHTKEEFSVGSFEEQCTSIRKTQELARHELGIVLTCFGSPHNNSTETTISALREVAPEITDYFFAVDGDSRTNARQLLIRCNMETKPGNIDFDYFLEQYRICKDMPFMVIQGHPDEWQEKDFKLNEKIMQFLRDEGNIFVTPHGLPFEVEEHKVNAEELRYDILGTEEKFALYGAGEIGRETVKFLRKYLGLTPKCFIISDGQPREEQMVCGCPVLCYSEYKERFKDCTIVLTMMPNLNEKIKTQLILDKVSYVEPKPEKEYLEMIAKVRWAIMR